MGFEESGIYNEDCISGMQKLEPGVVDLAFADPPFNIGYKYDVYRDSLDEDETAYLESPAIATVDEISRLQPVNPQQDGNLPSHLEAMKRVVEAVVSFYRPGRGR